MSITLEKAKAHMNEPAVTCCRFAAGTVIGPSNLEDPSIVFELKNSGLLKIQDDCLKIGEVLGSILKRTVDGLTPLTLDLLDGVKRVGNEGPESAITERLSTSLAGARIKIHIGEGKNIDLEFPLAITEEIKGITVAPTTSPSHVCPLSFPMKAGEAFSASGIIRKLLRKHFRIEKVQVGKETKIEGTTLYIRENICQDAMNSQDLVVDMKLDIISPDNYGEYSETIMDVQPVAVKEEGELGEGVTRVLDGVVILVTGTDERGIQISEFGSSEGSLDKKIMWGRAGSPDKGEMLIRTNVQVKAYKNMERSGPLAVHKATDFLVQEIRKTLKEADESLVSHSEKLLQRRRPGKKKVAIVKEIMGQGAMHDNLIMPVEPVGILGSKSIMDLGNVPIVVSPLQMLDGCVHALTCVGPASKETSRHYWREPLVIEIMNDEELDLCAVVLVGSPQANSEKFYVSQLLGMTLEAMDLDGAIVTTEGFGNNHIDFACHIEKLGKRGIPVVGMTYSAVQGQLIAGNPYMDAMIELNKSAQGIETEVLEENCLAMEDAIRAVMMLKAKMAGEKIEAAEREWNPEVKLRNIRIIEQVTGRKIESEPNETSIEDPQ